MKIEIWANSWATPLGYRGHAEIVVDELSLSYISSTSSEKKSEEIRFYPNPSTGKIFFKDIRTNGIFELYTFDGKLVKSGVVTNELIDIQDEGAYILKYKTPDESIISKLIVRK